MQASVRGRGYGGDGNRKRSSSNNNNNNNNDDDDDDDDDAFSDWVGVKRQSCERSAVKGGGRVEWRAGACDLVDSGVVWGSEDVTLPGKAE